MEKNNKIDNYKNLISKTTSGWLQKAKWRKENKYWLKKSQKIALNILQALDNLGITQVDLAEKLNVEPQQINRIVKGSENLTLKTICKLEIALGITLISVDSNVFLNSGDVSTVAINAEANLNKEPKQKANVPWEFMELQEEVNDYPQAA